MLTYWVNLVDFFIQNKLDVSSIKVGDLAIYQKELDVLYKSLVLHEKVNIRDASEDMVIKTFKIINKEVVVFFKKNPDGDYYGKNLVIDDFGDIEILINNKPVLCSKFLSLLPIFRDKISEHIGCLQGFEENVLYSLKELYRKEMTDNYIVLLLAYINGYDNNTLPLGLDLAEGIGRIVAEKENGSRINNVIKINNFQIKARRLSLDSNDKIAIEALIKGENKNHTLICCAYILLRNKKGFNCEFEYLTDQEKQEFMSWPIWKLCQTL